MACLHLFMSLGYETTSIFVDYGQLANKIECKASSRISEYFNSSHYRINCDNMPLKKGEIVGRNALLINLALYLIDRPSALIVIGIHSGTNYVDCTRRFVENMQNTADLYTDGRIQIIAPFLEWSKMDIFDYCLQNNLPIGLTYSCELGTEIPCGQCLSCKDREAIRNECTKQNNRSS